MSSFAYPGKDRLAPRVRRLTGGILIAGILVGGFLWIRPFLSSGTFEGLLALTPLSKEKFEALIGNRWAGFLVFITLAWVFSKSSAVDVLEFHLFPWFDHETLSAIGVKTGLLRWVDLEGSPAHEAAARLRAWLGQDIHDGAWAFHWVLRGRPQLGDQAFRYALLLGPNGIGKSQMARELARERLGHRPHAASHSAGSGLKPRKRRGAVRWLRRVLPRLARLHDDPWHVGELIPAGDWSERLAAWRPSAPTAVVLDDPHGNFAREAIDILDKNCGKFWYSVRLIVVDQFTPSKLELEAIGHGRHDHLGREILTVAMADVHWSGEQARQVFAGGVWIRDGKTGQFRLDAAQDISEFWQTSALDRLCGALDGNPLMLAEAAVWLMARNERGRPFRTIHSLLSLPQSEEFERAAFDGRLQGEYRAELAHRILSERVDEVFASHLAWAREMMLDEVAVIAAACCASLANGAPIASFEVFARIQGSRLEKWIVRGVGGEALLPPVGSWPISEVFVQRALRDFRHALQLGGLVTRAVALNPAGVARQMTQRGLLAREIFEMVQTLQQHGQDTASLALSLFEVAASRAIWADRNAMARALEWVDELSPQELGKAQARLAEIGTCRGPVPDVLVAATLMTALGARRFAGGGPWDWSAWRAFHMPWSAWFTRIGDSLNFVPSPLSDCLVELARKLYEAVLAAADRLPSSEETFLILQDVLLEAPNASLFTGFATAERSEDGCTWSRVFRDLFELKRLSLDDRAILAAADEVRRQYITLSTRILDEMPADGDAKLRACVSALILRRRSRLEAEAGASLADMESLLAQLASLAESYPHEEILLECWQFCACQVLRRLRETDGDPGRAWGIACEVEARSQAFPGRGRRTVLNLAWCWGYAFSLASLDADDAFHATMQRLRDHSAESPYVADVAVGLARAYSLRIESVDKLGQGDAVDARLAALASEMDAMALPLPDYANVQWGRATGWLTIATRVADLPAGKWRNRDIARRMDSALRPFRYHVLQTSRLWILENYARHESQYGEGFSEAELIARRLTGIAETAFGMQRPRGMAHAVASAWRRAVDGWCRDRRAGASAERALRRLEDWVAANQPAPDLAFERTWAWGSLIALHWSGRAFDELVRLEPEAMRCAEAALAFSDDMDIGEIVAYLFATIAAGRRDRGMERAAIEELAARIRQLMEKFPRASSIRNNNAFVEGILHLRATKVPTVLVPKRQEKGAP